MSTLYALLFMAATLILVVGVGAKVVQYYRTPAPLRIPTTPAPVTRTGVFLRMTREVLLFESLFKASKWTWLLGWLFHVSLLLVLLRHLRYFIDPVWLPIQWVQPLGIYAGFVLVVALAGLLIRRIHVDRVRYISAPSDFMMLILLILIALSGLTMKFLLHTDIVAVKGFFTHLWTLGGGSLPLDFPLLLHLALVALLMIIFPFSKLLHAPGLFFSSTRNQVDNPRERRHIAPWAEALERQE